MKALELVGQLFGRWTVLSANGVNEGRKRLWLCRCECGNERFITTSNLVTETSKSCGCLKVELQTKHGCAKDGNRSPEYRSWYAMIQRCTNPKNTYYKNYGGRGVCVIKEWRDSFDSFLGSMGQKPSEIHSLDRIDVNGNYEPSNCKWSTKKEQNRNKVITNANGVPGVYWDEKRNNFRVSIGFDGKYIHLGRYKEREDAIRARIEAEFKYWGKSS